MNVISFTVNWHLIFVYSVYNVIFYWSPQDHIAHNCNVITLTRNAEVTFNLEKCLFFSKTIDYLEHFISHRRLKIASHTTITIT